MGQMRSAVLWVAIGLAGIGVTGAATYVTSHLSRQAVGQPSAPPLAGADLAPATTPRTTTTAPRRTTTRPARRRTTTRPATATRPATTTPSPAPRTTPAAPVVPTRTTPRTTTTAPRTDDRPGGTSSGHGSDHGSGDD